MVTPKDLHLDDTAHRRVLQRALVHAREAAGLSKARLAARVGRDAHTVSAWERGQPNWMHGTLQRWAAGLGLTLGWELHDLPDPAPPDTRTVVLSACQPGFARDRALMVDTLRRVRLACGVSLRQLATVAGVKEPALCMWETGGADDVFVAAAQRHARALGGRLTFHLTPGEGGGGGAE